MAIQFPNNPGIGSVFIDSDSGFSYEWTGVVWKSFSPASTSNIKELDDISSSFDNSTTTFNLTIDSAAYKPVSAAMLQISLGGVIQEPTTDYTVSFADATITFTTAPNAGLDFFGVVRGTSVSIITSDGVLDTLSVTGVSTVGVVTGATSIQSGVYYGDGSQLTGISVDSTSLKDDGGNVKAQANPGGVVITGVATATGFKVGAAISVSDGAISATRFHGDGSNLTGIDATSLKDSGGNVKAQANPGGVVITGVATATTFKGDLTGDVTGDVTGNADTATTATNAQGLSGSPTIAITNLTGVAATFTGNVTIGGTLTYQDVTNIDSVGIITAQQGIQVLANGVDVTGIGTFEDRITYDGSLGQAGGAQVDYAVTVATKDSTHRYNGSGSSNGYVIDNLQAPVLTLTPGRTYFFDQSDSTNSSHPLRFYLEADKTTQYTTNVTAGSISAGTAGAGVTIVVGDSTPNVLHYQCSSHGYMGNSAISQSNVAGGFNVVDESSDTSCNVLFTTDATGTGLQAKTGTNLTFNSNTGALTATSFSGDGSALTGVDAGISAGKATALSSFLN